MTRNRRWLITLLMVTGLMLVAATGVAQAQEITRATFNSGGGTVSSADFSLRGGIGEAVGGTVRQAGGGVQVCSGFNCGPGASPSSSATLGISAANADKDEGNSGPTAFTFTVSRSDDTSGTTTVKYKVTGSGSDPANGADFTGGNFPEGTVTFNDGETNKTVTIDVNGDTEEEPDEGFTVSLSEPSGGANIGTTSANGTIQNDDLPAGVAQLGIQADNADRDEGNSGPTAFTFAVGRSNSTSGTTTVKYTVTGSGSDQANGADFTGNNFPADTLTFNEGESSKTVTINVNGDTDPEPDEGFTVTLSEPSGSAQIGTSSASGIIRDDDGSAPPPATSVVINEVYYVGDQVGDWIEIKNLSNNTVDVSQWWLCSEITYEKIANLDLLAGADLSLAPGEIIQVRAWRDLGNDKGDMGLYSTNDFPNKDAMVDFVQWGTPNQIGRSTVAASKGIWTEISTGVFDFVPAASAGQSMAYRGTNSGGGDLTKSSDFRNGTPTPGQENSSSSSSDKDLYLPGVRKN